MTDSVQLLSIIAAKERSLLLEQLPEDSEAWFQLIEHAAVQRVIPLLRHRLITLDAWHALPSAAEKRLNAYYQASAAVSLKLFWRLRQLCTAFSEAQLPFVVLKGAHLAECVYPSRLLRPMIDIDLLVPEAYIEPADEILQAHGYIPPQEKAWYRANHYHFLYKSAARDVPVELHWNIQRPDAVFSVDIAQWLSASRQVPDYEAPLTVFPLEEALLFTCLHMVKHLCQDGILPLFDIAAIIDAPGEKLDWDRLIAIASRDNLQKPLYLSLKLAEDLVAVDVPQHHLHRLGEVDLAPHIYQWFKNRLLRDNPQRDGSQVSVKFAKLWREESFLQKVRLITTAVTQLSATTPPAGANRAGSDRLPLNRLARHGQQFFRLLTGDKEVVSDFEVMDWLSTT